RSPTPSVLRSFSTPLTLIPRSFFVTATAPTQLYTLSLHDALPISSTRHAETDGASSSPWARGVSSPRAATTSRSAVTTAARTKRSEEHTSELQSHLNLVCRLLLEKKKKLDEHAQRLL